MNFNELNLHREIVQGIDDMGFVQLTAVQEQTLPQTLTGRDMLVQSQTGTGKTAAFLITIFELFLQKKASSKQKALIIAPTRELAVQIEKEAKDLGRHLPFVIGSFYGGVGYHQQETLLRRGVDVMVGTPGRLLDFSQKGLINFKDITVLVIDEADRLFDMGFLPDIRRMLRRMVEPEQRQTMLYSATLLPAVRSIAADFMNRPGKVEIAPEQVTVETITQELFHVGNREKLSLLLGILKKRQPRNALIFTNMKHTAERLAKKLEMNGLKCRYLTGDLAQSKRLQTIDDFKAGRLPFLVATDVAARGLHIDDLEMVVNYDLPGDCQNYVHRIGRTARVGKSGLAVSLACENFVENLAAIESIINQKIPVQYAPDELFVTDRSPNVPFRSREPRQRSEHGQRRGGPLQGRRSGNPRGHFPRSNRNRFQVKYS